MDGGKVTQKSQFFDFDQNDKRAWVIT